MENWAPHILAMCLDSEVLAYVTAGLSVGMLVWYLMIAWRWYESMQLASNGGRAVWFWLLLIFVVCAMAGYVSVIMSLEWPKLGSIWRITFLAIQNVTCPFFWFSARKHQFKAHGMYQAIGETIVAKKPDEMSDRELAVMVRTLIGEYTKRMAQ